MRKAIAILTVIAQEEVVLWVVVVLPILRVVASCWVCGWAVSRGRWVHVDCERSASQPLPDIHRCTWGHSGPVELGVFWGVVSPRITSQ